jgi:glutaredoxin
MKRVIEIFGKTDCPNCTKAKAFCEKNSLEFDYGILDEHFTKEELLQEFPTAKSMPQIRVITDDVIENLEGYDGLVQWFADGLTELVKTSNIVPREEGASEGVNFEGTASAPTQQKTGVELKFLSDGVTPIAFKIKNGILLTNTWVNDENDRPFWDANTWVKVDLEDGVYDYDMLLENWED